MSQRVNFQNFQSMTQLSDFYVYNLAFLGERPYNNDNLISDSMKFQEELLNDIEITSIPDLNSTQIAEEVDDLFPLTKDTEETINPIRDEQNNASGSSDAVRVIKVNTPVKVSSTMKKSVSSRKIKKRTSEIK